MLKISLKITEEIHPVGEFTSRKLVKIW